MIRPAHLPGLKPGLRPQTVLEIRKRVAKRERALQLARQHCDKRIAQDLDTTPKIVRAIAQHRAYKWVRSG